MSVLEKASTVVDVLAAAGRPVRLAEVANDLGLPKSSVHRLLTELCELRILRRTQDSQFALGPRLLTWGNHAANSFVIKAVAEPWMRNLRDTTGESVHLYVREEQHRVCLASVEGRSALRPVVPTGGRQPLGIGSAGKLLLAFAPEAVIEDVLEAGAGGQHRLPTRDELDRIRAERWAVSIDEREMGLSGAAAAVSGSDGDVLAALSLSGSSFRLTEERYAELKDDVFSCASSIGAAVSGTG